MQMSSLAVADAMIRHRRYLPKSHHFETQLNYLWFDPEQIETITQQSYLWSSKRWNILTLDPDDFLIMEQGSIREKVAKILDKQANFILPFDAEIRVLALPRTCGFRFNSVVFYFIFDIHDQPLFILSEITNTPWNERHVYAHDCRHESVPQAHPKNYVFEFKKSFHVSPFMPMQMDYRWHFNLSAQRTIIHMQLWQQEILQFDATMRFSLSSITFPSQQHRYAISSVFEPFKMMAGIYWNATRLWIKKVPFYRHPKKENGNNTL